MAEQHHKGSCLCGSVTYEGTGEWRDVSYCHCGQCRKTSGHYFAATALPKEQLNIRDRDGSLVWYRASDIATRGFCNACGSSLFWNPDDEDHMSVLVGSLDVEDGRTGLKSAVHIFADDALDYFTIGEDVPVCGQGRATPVTKGPLKADG